MLVRIAQVIEQCLRSMDSAYRYGGEEFTIILPETNSEEALTVAERLRKAVEGEDFYPNNGKRVQVTISVGVTEFSRNERKSEFVHRADKAMYLSKEKGRNRVSVLSPDQNS